MKLCDAYFTKNKILTELFEHRLYIFCGTDSPIRNILPPFPLPQKNGQDEGMAVCRQMEQAIKREGKAPPVFSFNTGWETDYLADGEQNLLEFWKEAKPPCANVGRLFFILRKIRAGDDADAPKILGAIFRGPFGVGAYARDLSSWLGSHPGMKKQPLLDFCWKQLWHSPDPKVVQFSLLVLWRIAKNDEELFKPIVRFLAQCAEFTPYCTLYMSQWSDSNQEVFSVAKGTGSWARYCAIIVLQPETPEIRAWLIEQAYQDSDMPMNFAYLCAVKGELYQVLKQESISQQAFSGAAALLTRLVYPDKNYKGLCDISGAAVLVERYTAHAARMARTLDDCYALFAAYRSTEIYTYKNQALCEKVRAQSKAILQTQRCADIISKGLAQAERKAFVLANFLEWPYWDLAMRLIRQDFWKHYHLADFLLPRNFYVEEIIAIFEKNLPLRKFRLTKDRKEPVFPRQKEAIRIFLYILDKLEEHPGQGERLLLEGVKSGYYLHRDYALWALGKWEELPKNIKKQLVLAERRYGYDEKDPLRPRLRQLSGREKRPPEEPAKECTLTLLKNEPH